MVSGLFDDEDIGCNFLATAIFIAVITHEVLLTKIFELWKTALACFRYNFRNCV